MVDAYVAVCVEKVNSVWHLEHIAMPFTKEGQRHNLKCKHTGVCTVKCGTKNEDFTLATFLGITNLSFYFYLGSKDFNSAISDMRQYFPDGVFVREKKAIFKDCNVCTLIINFNDIIYM